MNSALWIIPILPFVLAFFTTWSLREAIAETVWFNVAWLAALGVVYAMELADVGLFSTSPTGAGGAVALGIGFVALVVRRRQWRKERRRIAEARAREAARRAVANKGKKPEEKSLIVDAFRFAGQMQRARKRAKR